MATLNIKQSAIFYDNEMAYIKDVNKSCKSNILTVKIPETGMYPPIDLETNLYYLYLQKSNSTILRFDQHSGIQKEHIESLKDWVLGRKGKSKHIFFDWDLTLSMVSGIIIPDVPPDSSLKTMYKMELNKEYSKERIYDDILLYLMGGPDRLKLIKEMFQFLKKHSVKVTILTNNPTCAYTYKAPYFKELVYRLAGNKAIKFICGSEYNYNKGTALATVRPAICKQTRRNLSKHTKRKQTRKQKGAGNVA